MTKKTIVLTGLIVLKFLLHFILISPEYDLQRDEFLHLDQGQHLAWGFLSVPPFTSWISYLIHLLGNAVFWVKFFPALFGALTILVVWKAIAALDGSLFAQTLGVTSILFSAILRLNILYQPNSFDVLSWSLFYFIFIQYAKTENTKWLFIGALVFAIGFLNKYNIIFLLIGLFPAILLTEQRKVFAKKEWYYSVLLALFIISPNLFWQFNNNFPVIHHLKELSSTQLIHINRLDFLKSQIFYVIGSLAVIISALYALLFYNPYKKYRAFLWSIFFTLIVFMYFRAKDYYAIGLYPIYLAFGSVFLEFKISEWGKKWLQPVLLAIPILMFIPMYNIIFPNKSPEYIVNHRQEYQKLGLLRWEDGKDHLLPQDFADMLGWKELAVHVDSVCATLPNLENTLILCDNYGQAGAINYYTKNKKIIAQSLNADYLNWLRYDKKIIDVVLVKESNDDDKNRKDEIPLFDTVYLADQRINPFAREDTISIYVLRGARVDINQRIKAEATEKKMYR